MSDPKNGLDAKSGTKPNNYLVVVFVIVLEHQNIHRNVHFRCQFGFFGGSHPRPGTDGFFCQNGIVAHDDGKPPDLLVVNIWGAWAK